MKFIGANEFENFISGYGIWIIIGCLGVAFIVSVIFLFLNVNKVKKARLENSTPAKPEPVLANIESKKEIEKIEPVKEDEKKQIASEYNISYDKEKDEWVVKKAGASRASKRCKTKEEALEAIKTFLKK